jgi:hypothetical protein
LARFPYENFGRFCVTYPTTYNETSPRRSRSYPTDPAT